MHVSFSLFMGRCALLYENLLCGFNTIDVFFCAEILLMFKHILMVVKQM